MTWSKSPNIWNVTYLAETMSRMTGIPKEYKEDLQGLYKAYYNRPWKHAEECTLDDVCILAAQENVDPVPLARMVFSMGECKEDIDCASEVRADGRK